MLGQKRQEKGLHIWFLEKRNVCSLGSPAGGMLGHIEPVRGAFLLHRL